MTGHPGTLPPGGDPVRGSGTSGGAFGRRRARASWPAGWTIASATTRRARGRGLLGRDGLDDLEGLWLPVRSVHTFGMRFALDLVWLDGAGAVLAVDEDVERSRIRTRLAARGGVVEVRWGRGPALAAAIGR